MQDSDLSLVIPCYNEEPILEKSIREVMEVLDATTFIYEIIFVDDCSIDRTRLIIDDIIARHPDKNLKRIFHMKNIGRGGTVMDGFRLSQGRIMGFIDIDLEVSACYIPSCILAINNGRDIATIFRAYKFHFHSIDRYFMSKGYSWLMRKLLNVPLRDTETGFKFFKREKILPLLDEIKDRHWFWDTEIMVRSYLKGYKIVEIPGVFSRRWDKPSSVNNIPDTIYYFKKLWKFKKELQKQRNRY